MGASDCMETAKRLLNETIEAFGARAPKAVEWLNQEARRRERVIRIFPNEESAIRLIGAAFLGDHLAHRQEQVRIRIEAGINLVEPLHGLRYIVALVADNLQHVLQVFLLHVGVIVLLVGTGPGEGKVMLLAKAKQLVIDKLTAVVAVQAPDRCRPILDNGRQFPVDAGLTTPEDCPAAAVAADHIHHAERVSEVAKGRSAVVLDQVNLESAGPGLVPGLALHRDLRPQAGIWPSPRQGAVALG